MSVCIKSLIRNLNLVVGCSVGCAYCYARNNCRRFHMTDDFAVPEYMPRKLRIMDRRDPRVFLMTGMSDLSDWRPEWVAGIVAQARAQGVAVFMKEDLLPILGEEGMIQELPEAFKQRIWNRN